MKRTKRQKATALASVLLLAVVAGCGTSSDDDGGDGKDTPGSQGFTPPDVPMLEELGDMEGEANNLTGAGYAEDGSTHKAYD